MINIVKLSEEDILSRIYDIDLEEYGSFRIEEKGELDLDEMELSMKGTFELGEEIDKNATLNICFDRRVLEHLPNNFPRGWSIGRLLTLPWENFTVDTWIPPKK